MSFTLFKNLKWALSENGYMKINVFNEYQNNHEYLIYLDKLILDLKDYGIENIQKKFIGSSEIDDFHASISELEVVKKFLDNGYKINLYADKHGETSLPDFNANDSNYRYDIEVTRILEHDALNKMIDYIKNMSYNKMFFNIIINLSGELTKLLLSPKYTNNKKKISKIIGEGINEFENEMNKISTNNHIKNINTRVGVFSINKIPESMNYNWVTIGWTISQEQMLDTIKNRIIEKSKKRLSHNINNSIFLIFIILEHQLIPSKVVESTLNSLLLDKKGLFYSNNIINNVGAVIGKRYDKYFIFMNPNAKDIKNITALKEKLNFL